MADIIGQSLPGLGAIVTLVGCVILVGIKAARLGRQRETVKEVERMRQNGHAVSLCPICAGLGKAGFLQTTCQYCKGYGYIAVSDDDSSKPATQAPDSLKTREDSAKATVTRRNRGLSSKAADQTADSLATDDASVGIAKPPSVPVKIMTALIYAVLALACLGIIWVTIDSAVRVLR